MILAFATLLAADPAASEIVIVRGERLRVRDDGAATSVTLTGADLQGQAGTRLDEALRVVSGVGLFRRTPSTAANATIQGLSLRPIAPNGAGRALVTLDGVPQNDPFGGWIYWGRYDPSFLASAEVKRGGAGAGFGPQALTGVLDLTEARGAPDLASFSVGTSGALNGSTRYSAQAGGATFTAMAVYDATGGDFAVARVKRGPVDQRIDSRFVGATLVTDIARDNGAWSFRASGFTEAKGAGLMGAQSAAAGLDVSAARRVEGAWGQARLLVFAQGRDFSNQAVSVNAARTLATPSLDQMATPSSALGGSILVESEGLPRLTLDWRRAEGETQELFRYVGGGFTRARIAGGSQDLAGLGLATSRPLTLGTSGVSIDGALRLDYWANSDARRLETDRASGIPTLSERPKDASGSVATGQVTARFGPVSASAYRTFRPPSLNELHRPFRVGNDITEANAALMPETLSGIDLTARGDHAFARGILSSDVTLYANRLYGPITNVTIATGPGNFARVGFLPAGGALRERRNAGRIDATGVEGRFSWQGGRGGPTGYVALSITDARVQGRGQSANLTGKRPTQAPAWSGAAGITWPLTPSHTLSVAVRGEGMRFDDDLNTRRLPAFGALDVRYDAKLNSQTTVFLSVQNMLDQPIATARAGDGLASVSQVRVVRIGVQVTPR